MQGPWRDYEQLERAAFQWVTWYNEERLHSALDCAPPAEYEQDYWRNLEEEPLTARTMTGGLYETRFGSLLGVPDPLVSCPL
ncbi:integrase core domain-containing protein [Streptomyces sp. 3N207]|uniref:integrase core domain-containing protein n=1 Tax=Streptomyces sp. 3N207 TaxID=3457417 RepID=UPI003FD251EE